MDTFLIIGICFLCYEMCDMIMHYAKSQTTEPRRSLDNAAAPSSAQRVFSISKKIQSRLACCPQ